MSIVKLSIPSEIGYELIAMVVGEKLAFAMDFSPGRMADVKTAISEILVPIVYTNFQNLQAHVMIETTFLVKTKALIIKVFDPTPPPSVLDLSTDPAPPPQYHIHEIVYELVDKVETTSTAEGTEIEMTFNLEQRFE